MDKYITLDNLEVALKFTSIISTGLFAGGAIYVGASHMPGILAMTDMDQALMNFRFFWPRVKMMVRPYTKILRSFSLYLCTRAEILKLFEVYSVAIVCPWKHAVLYCSIS